MLTIMHLNSWIPNITFRSEHDSLCIILTYYNNMSVKIQHPSWNIAQDVTMSYNDISTSLKNFLYLDLKGRPAVHAFLQSGPPGDHDHTYTSSDINELAGLLTASAKSEYLRFIQNY